MKTFFNARDYGYYLDLIAKYKKEMGVEVLAYCLMPNHVHFVVVPQEKDGLSQLFREVHRHYTRHVNFRESWKGHLWQERFHSFVMDERYLMATVRYVELNPVKAKLCVKPEAWQWSSARAHLLAQDDHVVTVEPMLNMVSDWKSYLLSESVEDELDAIRRFSSSGRPAGSETFIHKLEGLTGRELSRKKPGPKPRIK
jgi:putative transposase